MTPAPVEPQGLASSGSAGDARWSRGRLAAAIAIVFAGQLVLIFWLQGRPADVPIKHAAVPAIHWTANGPGELLALQDPTLFVLPHREGFSGEAWLKTAALTNQTPVWSEPLRPLTLAAQNLGTTFQQFILENPPRTFPDVLLESDASPESPSAEPLSVPSTFHVAGDLARRRLLSVFQLEPWPNSDLLTNTVVQLLVDARGNTVSAALLPPGCGLSKADQSALALAKTARFEPIAATVAKQANPREPALTLGAIIFEWQTVPLPLTNSLAVP
ncbi:MAG: hypothetical protein QOD03_1648 [Verrucomicrobiota bacterium]